MTFTFTSPSFLTYTGTLTATVAPEPAPRYIGYRVRHRSEGGRETPNAMPCVNPSQNIPSVIFTEALQYLSYDLNRHNPLFTGKKWRVVYGGGVAFCNGQGYDDPRAGPRRDYINHLDLTAEFPKLMKAIICSGNFFTGSPVRYNSADYIQMVPGVDAIDATKPLPSVDEVLERNWYFVATTARYDVNGAWKVSNFPQGSGMPVYIPFVLPAVARYTASWFTPWDEEYLPDPLTVYLK